MDISDDLLYQYAPEARNIWLATSVESANIVGHEFSDHFVRKMQKLIRRQGHKPMSQLKRVAVLILISATVLFSSLMAVEACRERVIEIFINIYERFTTFGYQTDSQGGAHDLGTVHLEYVPEGFIELEREEDNHTSYLYLEHANGDYFEVEQTLLSVSTSHEALIDTEDAIVKTVFFGGHEATMITKNGENMLTWVDSDCIYLLRSSIDEATMMRVADGVKNIFE